MAQILDGSALAQQINEQTKLAIHTRLKEGHRAPGLAVILVGADPASEVYVNKKRAACEAAGIHSNLVHLPENTPETELVTLIESLNNDKTIDGILVQLPLPEHLNSDTLLQLIRHEKDVDGFHPHNIGLLALRQPQIRPCTPMGIMKLLETTEQDLTGKEAVVVGASNIVGRPMALELLLAGCTVTVCHKFTQHLQQHIQRAEVLVVGVGKPEFIPGNWIKPDAIVIDVGINRLPSGKLVGDIEFSTAKEQAKWITPVPGGVGPMTVAMLLQNTLLAAQKTIHS